MISGKGKYVFHRGEEKQRSLDTQQQMSSVMMRPEMTISH